MSPPQVPTMKLFKNLFKAEPQPTLPANTVVVVSGLPRSGTSMMMKMLEAGGLAVLSDGLREADTDNPKGYYEFERVKQLDKGDGEWMADAVGKVVKVIAALLEHLPPGFDYQVLFMNRHLEEVLASQGRMLEHRGEDSNISDEKLGELLQKHVNKTKSWVSAQPNFTLIDVDYNQMLIDPAPYVREVNQFLNGVLNEAAMARVVDPSLYRNRS